MSSVGGLWIKARFGFQPAQKRFITNSHRFVPISIRHCLPETSMGLWHESCSKTGMTGNTQIAHRFTIKAEPTLAYLALTEQHHFAKWWSSDSLVEKWIGGRL